MATAMGRAASEFDNLASTLSRHESRRAQLVQKINAAKKNQFAIEPMEFADLNELNRIDREIHWAIAHTASVVQGLAEQTEWWKHDISRNPAAYWGMVAETTGETLVSFGKGVYKGAESTVTGTWDMLTHPRETVDALGAIFSQPIDVTVKQLVDQQVDAFNKDPAEAIGELGFSAIFTLITAGAGGAATSAKTATKLKDLRAMEKAAQKGVKADQAAEQAEMAALRAMERNNGRLPTREEARKMPPEERIKYKGIDLGDGRDTYGQYTGFDAASAAKQDAGLQRYEKRFRVEVIRDQIVVRLASGEQARKFDGLAMKADGTYEGIEVKSGRAIDTYNQPSDVQRLFDSKVGYSNQAIGTLPDGSMVRVTSVVLETIR